MKDTKQLLGLRIRELRLAKNLKQAELAEIIGVDARSISRIESGYHFPKDEHLKKFANALGVEIKDLFTFSHIEKSKDLKSAINELVSKADETQLLTIYRVIDAIIK